MKRHDLLFGTFIVAFWGLGVLAVYIPSATGNGRFLEIAFKLIFTGSPILAGLFLSNFHNSKVGGENRKFI